MGVFIRVTIDEEKCLGPEKSGACVAICPVNIFEVRGDRVVVEEANEDECTLCNLCIDKCPGSAISIRKLYE
jgi:NAD-dependent dihydropyrimidine dehydrogenase PreA subunit